jgi:predicted metal-dependent phosphoesterase TrpH
VFHVELHAHSALSYDARDPVDALLEQARAVGLDALAVTDHDEIDASLNAVDRAPEYGLLAIPGLEVSSRDGHVLALGVEELIPSDRPFRDTVDRIRDSGGIAVVPHPFQESRNGVLANISKRTLTIADAIEVYNSRLVTGYSNRQAKRFARKEDMPMVAGSDAHISSMVGRAITHVDAAQLTVTDILEAITDGRTTIKGRRTPWHISFRQAASSAKRRVKARLGRYL